LNEFRERLARIEEKITGIAKVNTVELKNIRKEIKDVKDSIDKLAKHVNEEVTDHQDRIRGLEKESTKNIILRSALIFVSAILTTIAIERLFSLLVG